ncbi:YggS family pyridoxal phosphate-dependent enzyme [[Phormidium] sp. ETS-05]|uniref:YggS family pyridoxal phosphate-dependent enzyme n=1 Tax=[Phormidium] sp. ETS-05 TaxID=222819 RepID=UPI0018EF1895|nr:YggS family pyridoxal phosphate-dependent enzyme [[Phormidium] sp. ETS-05]
MSSESIAERITRIRATLPPTVRLIAVSKYVSAVEMRAAYNAGIRDFGESRVQDAEAKKAELQDLEDITWHLIGHLQSNKARKAVQIFDFIHSCDSLKIVQKLDIIAGELSKHPYIFIQVKILPDPQKHGWEIGQLLADLPELDRCDNLRIEGLMVIPPLGLESGQTLALFEQARELAGTIAAQKWSRISMQHLSMGMSEDYPLAVEAGATFVRLGQILFGDV